MAKKLTTPEGRAVRTITRRISSTNTLLFLILATQWLAMLTRGGVTPQ